MSPGFGELASLLRTPAVLAVTDKHHGLGNRVRAVLGARVLAAAEGRSFAYTWPTGKQFGARFDDLWDFDAPLVGTTASRLAARRFPYRDNQLRWLDGPARSQRLWQIRTPHALVLPPLCPPWESELRALVPSLAVQRGIHRAAARAGSGAPVVGVMIRTHTNAHQETLKHSPLAWYLGRMREIHDIWPEVQFYVCADTPAAFLEVARMFPRCLGTANKGPYNSKAALTASVVDVYMLASSAHLLAPHYSSFPELSARLAGPQLRLETSLTGPASALASRDGCTFAPNPLQPSARHQVG